MTIVIVMPTYNEAACIGDMINVLLERIFPEITRAKMHLLIVDDDSSDRTGDVVRAMALRYPCLHLLTGTRRGLGWAYVRGMKYAMEVLHADAVMEMDAELRRMHRGNPHPFSRTPGRDNQVFPEGIGGDRSRFVSIAGKKFPANRGLSEGGRIRLP